MRKGALETGFTLLELLVVLAIMGIVGVLAVPLSVRAVEAARLRADARALALSLRGFQQEARSRQSTIVLDDASLRLKLPRDAAVILKDGAPLIYFADGTSGGGSLRLSEHGRSLDLEIAWMTGEVRFGDVP